METTMENESVMEIEAE